MTRIDELDSFNRYVINTRLFKFIKKYLYICRREIIQW